MSNYASLPEANAVDIGKALVAKFDSLGVNGASVATNDLCVIRGIGRDKGGLVAAIALTAKMAKELQ